MMSKSISNSDNGRSIRISAMVKEKDHQEVMRYARALNMTYNDFIMFLFEHQRRELNGMVLKNLNCQIK